MHSKMRSRLMASLMDEYDKTGPMGVMRYMRRMNLTKEVLESIQKEFKERTEELRNGAIPR